MHTCTRAHDIQDILTYRTYLQDILTARKKSILKEKKFENLIYKEKLDIRFLFQLYDLSSYIIL